MKKPVILSILVTLSLLFAQCDNGKKKDRPNTDNNNELKQTNYSMENPPKFRKDGDLSFLDAGTGIEKFKIAIEVASTDEEKARGLMYRPEMADNMGMLFLFDRDEIQSFYMRNTVMSLDIIYVNSKMIIVDIYRATNPMDETSLPSKSPAMYVVEVNANICEKYGIHEGDKIIF